MNPLESNLYESFVNYAKDKPIASVYTIGAFDDPRLLCKYSVKWISGDDGGTIRLKSSIDFSEVGINIHDPYILDIYIAPQSKMGGYILDFHMSSQLPDINIAVEIDGHDWHEKNKEQAAADKRRGRELLIDGIQTIRFTGSEVYTNPNKVADECIKTFMATAYHLVANHPSFYLGYIEYLKGVSKNE
jgi:very-short-patch-repair endonuclease